MQGTYARVAPRSGLAAKKMRLARSVGAARLRGFDSTLRSPRIHTGAGVVDYDYRGEACAWHMRPMGGLHFF